MIDEIILLLIQYEVTYEHEHALIGKSTAITAF